MSLLQVFGIDDRSRVISIVGAGGKTTLMYGLARGAVDAGRTVITTTTTKIFPPDSHRSPQVCLLSHIPDWKVIHDALGIHRHVTVASRMLPVSKLEGIDEDDLQRALLYADMVIVEADGSAGRPIKAPEAWEPVIPECSDLVIPVVGLDALGKPLHPRWVFRLERFLEVTSLPPSGLIDGDAVATLLASAEGGMKSVPEGVRVAPFLNKMDTLEDEESIETIARAILRRTSYTVDRVVYGSLRARTMRTTFREIP